MPILLSFENDQEAMIFFDSHDTSEYMDEMEQVSERMVVERTQFPVEPAAEALGAQSSMKTGGHGQETGPSDFQVVEVCVRTEKDTSL